MNYYLIFYHILYIAVMSNIELWLFVLPFSIKFKRRGHFVLRLALFSICMIIFLFLLSYGIFYLLVYVFNMNTQIMQWLSPILNISTFIFVFGLFGICFKEKLATFTFVFSASVAANTFFTSLYSLLCKLFNLQTIHMIIIYPVNSVSIIIYFVTLFGCTTLMYLLFTRVFHKNNQIFSKNMNAYITTIFVLFSLFIIFVLGNPTLRGAEDSTIVIVYYSIISLFALLIILVERFILIWVRDWTEKGATEQFLKSYKTQMEVLRKNMDVVNVKCHDMKHQIGIMLGEKNIDEKYIKDIKKVISIYDNTLSTGNEYVDLLLSQKMLLCEQDGIELLCMVDGRTISFMEQEDINSLFGNAVDNAMEYLIQEEKENRFIRVLSFVQGGHVTLTIENYCSKNIKFSSEGIPITTKKDVDYHGFGVKSISMVAKKYHGKAFFIREDNLFIVSVVLPLKNA